MKKDMWGVVYLTVSCDYPTLFLHLLLFCYPYIITFLMFLFFVNVNFLAAGACLS